MVRAWAVRVAGDSGLIASELVSHLTTLAASERVPVTRAQLACTARRLPVAQGLPIFSALLLHKEDVSDTQIPHLVWWALEKFVSEDRKSVLDWFASTGTWDLPMVNEHLLALLMRRLAEEGREQDLLDCARLLRMAPTHAQKNKLMDGFDAAFAARSLAQAPQELIDAIAESGRLSIPLRLRRGDAEAIPEALRLAGDETSLLETRLGIVKCLGELAIPQSATRLLELSLKDRDPSVRLASVSALGSFPDQAIAETWIKEWSSFPAQVRRVVVGVLSSRDEWAILLLKAVQAGAIPSEDVPAEIRTGLAAHSADSVVSLAKALFPVLPASTKDVSSRIQSLRGLVASGAGNPYAGEILFQQRCSSCHQLFQKGGNLGPDLTRYQRDHLETLFASILDPNAEIREGFQFVTLQARDGRTISGFLLERDARRVVMRGLDGATLSFEQTAVISVEPVGRSLMPEGLLDGLGDQQLRDFFAFMRSAQPISK
jgi:putative heme-binding domain-containing protein